MAQHPVTVDEALACRIEQRVRERVAAFDLDPWGPTFADWANAIRARLADVDVQIERVDTGGGCYAIVVQLDTAIRRVELLVTLDDGEPAPAAPMLSESYTIADGDDFTDGYPFGKVAEVLVEWAESGFRAQGASPGDCDACGRFVAERSSQSTMSGDGTFCTDGQCR